MIDLKVGLQLYSVREEMGKDVENTLKEVKNMGYDYVEFAGYFGKSPREISGLLEKFDLKCSSVHQGYADILKNEEESMEYLKAVKAEYVAIPAMGMENHKGGPGFDKAVEDIKKAAGILKRENISLLYHNHEFEFKKYRGKFLLDWLFEEISQEHLNTQIDCCWVLFAGYDPALYLKKYENRSPVIHIKDFVCKNCHIEPVSLEEDIGDEEKPKTPEDCGFVFKPLGEGILNIPEILKIAAKSGTEYLIVEHDAPAEGLTEMQTAKLGREYLASLGL